MVERIELTAGAACLALVPELGGGIALLDFGDRPVLRPWLGNQEHLFSLACNILVPFSNRISRDGFEWNNVHHSITPNFPGERFAIHGDGFQKRWHCEYSGTKARLFLNEGAIGPWNYRAEQRIQLSECGLSIELSITNTGNIALPFGCGFHPWFPRTSASRLTFKAQGVWMEDKHHLPTEYCLLANTPDWDFSVPRALPAKPINNAYEGWQHIAHITQNENAVSCEITASNALNTAIVYSPGSDADFFCFEPVSHPVDAFNQPGYPGLRELPAGQTMQVGMKLKWSLS